MKLLLIHQNFVDHEHPGGTRHYELASHLVAHGDDVVIVSGNINYLSGKPVTKERRLVAKEELCGITILRAYVLPSLHHSFVMRVAAFLSFMVTSVFAGLRTPHVDIVMGTSPPIFQLISAWLVAAVRRKPFLLEVRDLWPEFAIDMGVLKNGLLIRLSRWGEKFLYRRATHLLVNSPAYKDYLMARGVSEDRISIIPNGADIQMFHPQVDGGALRQEWGLENKFIVMYAGALGQANDIPTILRAAQRLKDPRPDLHFVFVGDGKESSALRQTAEQWQLTNVTFAGTYPKSKMPSCLAAADACVATLQDIPMFRTTYPNKVFDYMAAGKPTLLVIDGVIREVVESSQGGVFVAPGDDDQLAKEITLLADDPGTRDKMSVQARAYVTEHFDRQKQATQFLELVTRLSSHRGG